MSLWVNAEWLDRCRFMKLLVISRVLSWLYQPCTGKKEEWQTCYSTITNVAFNFLPKFRPILGINLGFDLMDPGQVFESHHLPGPGLPLYKIQCVPRDCRYKMQNQVKFCHYKMQIYPTWIFGTKFSGDATCWSTACNLHFVPKPTSTLKNMYHLLPPMRFAFCTELWLAVIQDESDQFSIFLGPYLIFNNSKWN